VTAPDLAVVGTDGGRLQIVDGAADEGEIDDDGEERLNNGRHWREDKIGLLMTMTSDEHEVDPCPEVPNTFVDPLRILKLTRELKARSAVPKAPSVEDGTDGDAELLAEESTARKPPKVKAKHLVATRQPWAEFGPMMASAARPTGRCGGSIFRRSRRSWISFMRCRSCSRRRWRAGRLRTDGRVTRGGSTGC